MKKDSAAPTTESTDREFYLAAANALGRAAILGMGLQLAWVAILASFDSNWVISLHSRVMGVEISEALFAQAMYLGLLGLKLFVLVAFVIPWLAIRWMLWRRN